MDFCTPVLRYVPRRRLCTRSQSGLRGAKSPVIWREGLPSIRSPTFFRDAGLVFDRHTGTLRSSAVFRPHHPHGRTGFRAGILQIARVEKCSSRADDLAISPRPWLVAPVPSGATGK